MPDLNIVIDLFSKFEEKVNKPLLISVRRGLTYMIPLLLIGSLALVFISLPVPQYQEMMLKVFGSQWKHIFLYVRDGTFNILSIVMVICVSYSYNEEFGDQKGSSVSPIIAASVSLCSFIAISGISKDGFALSNFGVIGVFIAISVAVASSRLFLRLSSIRALRLKVFTDGANLTFSQALSSLYPASITITLFASINHILAEFFEISNLQNYMSAFLSSLFHNVESPLLSAVIFVLFVHIFWFFGLHGSNILEPVAQSIFVPALDANQLMLKSGQAPTEVFTKTFFDSFVLIGGCGTILCLIIAILIAGRHKGQLQLAKLSIIPVVFNINELVVFGVPIVLNPVYIIPFLFVPVLLTLVSSLAMYNGLVPYTSNAVEWTTPVFLSGYFSTGSVKGSILQLFNLLIGTLCYIPFVRLAQGVSEAQRRSNLNKVYAVVKQDEEFGRPSALLSRQDSIGTISRYLAAELENDIQNDKVAMHYQPQVDFNGNVIGVEALLRWNNENYGSIYPPLVIALAVESNLIDKLGCRIFDIACSELKNINNLGYRYVTVSVNISAVQLENENLVRELEEIINRHQVDPRMLMIEITEQTALIGSRRIINQIKAIRGLGIQLAMDDFGMGHSSLMHLKEYNFNTIKIDGSLVRELLTNSNCKNIISSIVYLCKTFNCSVLAEYVENEEQKNMLHELGCDQYQGYLYSKAVTENELAEYMASSRRTCKCQLKK